MQALSAAKILTRASHIGTGRSIFTMVGPVAMLKIPTLLHLFTNVDMDNPTFRASFRYFIGMSLIDNMRTYRKADV